MNYCMKNTKDLKAIVLYSNLNQPLFSKYYISYIYIYRSHLEENIMNTKNELFHIQNSAQLFYFKQLPNYAQLLYFKEWFRNHVPFQFFAVTDNNGIYFWEYEKESEEYKYNQLIASAQNGYHRRGEINEEGIYVVAGYYSENVKIYDMKYYNYPDHKIKLLKAFSHSDYVSECFFKNSVSAMCCDDDGYIKEYNLSNPHSIPTPTIFNKTTDLRDLASCMETKDKKYIIAGGIRILYILDAEDGTLTNTLNYSANGGEYVLQIAEIRPNILVTADYYIASLHDIRDIHNIPNSIKLPDVGNYATVISLESNSGDFAIGGQVSSTNLGFVYINHLEEDNQTINTLKYVDIQGNGCDIWIIKELKRGTIIFAGLCTEMCLWNYAAIPDQDPFCWDDQTGNYIWDIVGVPY